MAERRMISAKIVDDDQFLELPAGAQLLYFHLSMRADDDGLITPKKVMRMTGASRKDLDVLVETGYLIAFESGVVAITHWRINNYIRKDRHSSTGFTEELAQLAVVDGKYVRIDGDTATICQPNDGQMTTACQPSGNQMAADGQPNDNQAPSKNGEPPTKGTLSPCNPLSLQERKETPKSLICVFPKESPPKEPGHEGISWINPPTLKEVQNYFAASGLKGDPQLFFDTRSSVGWIDALGRKITDWRASARKWASGENLKGSPYGRDGGSDTRARDYDGSYDAVKMTEVTI